MDSATRARLARLIANAQRRPPPGTEETPEQVREAVRAILSSHCPPPPPDPLTGKVSRP
jgi:hypothetical protein